MTYRSEYGTITEVHSRLVRLPLESPIGYGNRRVSSREFLLVRVSSNAGMEGTAAALTRGLDLKRCVDSTIAPRYLGKSVTDTGQISSRIADDEAFFRGYGGEHARALSLVDLASFDLRARSLGTSVAELFGHQLQRLPVTAAAGYYREGVGPREVYEEFTRLADEGFTSFKIMIGGTQLADDVERLRAARRAVGNNLLSADLCGVWRGVRQAALMLGHLEELDLDYLEDPFPLANREAYEWLHQRATFRVAAGESASGRRALGDLVTSGVVDVLRPDATVAGGVAEFIASTSTASALDVPVVPHYYHDVHSQLAATATNIEAVEVVPTATGADALHRIIKSPVRIVDGMAETQPDHGFGISWRWEVVDRFSH